MEKRRKQAKKGRARGAQGKNKAAEEKAMLEARRRMEEEKTAEEEIRRAEELIKRAEELQKEQFRQRIEEKVKLEQEKMKAEIRRRIIAEEVKAEQKKRKAEEEEEQKKNEEREKIQRQQMLEHYMSTLVGVAEMTLAQRRKELEQRAKSFVVDMTANDRLKVDRLHRLIYEQGFLDGRVIAMREHIISQLLKLQSAFTDVGMLTRCIIQQEIAQAENAFLKLLHSSHQFSSLLEAHLQKATAKK